MLASHRLLRGGQVGVRGLAQQRPHADRLVGQVYVDAGCVHACAGMAVRCVANHHTEDPG